MSRPTADDTRAELREQQERTLEGLRRDGFLLQIWRRDDGAGAISYVEAESEELAWKRLNAMPFVAHGAIEIEVWPVTPRYECVCGTRPRSGG